MRKGMLKAIDTDLDNGDRVTLMITRSGALSLRTFTPTGRGVKLCYRLVGATTIPAKVMGEWAENLFLMNFRRLFIRLRVKHLADPIVPTKKCHLREHAEEE